MSAERGLQQMAALRAAIDELDVRIVQLLGERAACALEIGRLKEELGLGVYQPDRERAVLAHVRSINKGPLADDAIARLFERIIDEARRLEREAQREQPARPSRPARSRR